MCDLLSESGFKAVLGGRRNKEVLIDILNLLLPDGSVVLNFPAPRGQLPTIPNQRT